VDKAPLKKCLWKKQLTIEAQPPQLAGYWLILRKKLTIGYQDTNRRPTLSTCYTKFHPSWHLDSSVRTRNLSIPPTSAQCLYIWNEPNLSCEPGLNTNKTNPTALVYKPVNTPPEENKRQNKRTSHPDWLSLSFCLYVVSCSVPILTMVEVYRGL